jgi:hypothetical protein
MSILNDKTIESAEDLILSDEDRHTAFKIAQGFAYRYGCLYEDATTPQDRQRAHEGAIMWAKITEALRRLS